MQPRPSLEFVSFAMIDSSQLGADQRTAWLGSAHFGGQCAEPPKNSDTLVGFLKSWRGASVPRSDLSERSVDGTDRRPDLDSERMHHLRTNVSDRVGELALREFLVGEI